MKDAKISSLVKKLYTLDPEYTPERLDQVPSSWPPFNFKPQDSPMFEQFPRLLYHSCDLANVGEIRLIPGGWPKSSGRPRNYFSTMPPWSANMRKLAGTRAGPMYIAFDLELMMQHGCRMFQTDNAVLCLDWVPITSASSVCTTLGSESSTTSTVATLRVERATMKRSKHTKKVNRFSLNPSSPP